MRQFLLFGSPVLPLPPPYPPLPTPCPSKDNAAVFPIIESYLLLGAAAALTPLSSAIQVWAGCGVDQVVCGPGLAS